MRVAVSITERYDACETVRFVTIFFPCCVLFGGLSNNRFYSYSPVFVHWYWCPNASEVTLKDVGHQLTKQNLSWLYEHNDTKHKTTALISYGIYCTWRGWHWRLFVLCFVLFALQIVILENPCWWKIHGRWVIPLTRTNTTGSAPTGQEGWISLGQFGYRFIIFEDLQSKVIIFSILNSSYWCCSKTVIVHLMVLRTCLFVLLGIIVSRFPPCNKYNTRVHTYGCICIIM